MLGKSSLLNAILKEERAIVTEFEGTTRDTIEEFVSISGIPIKIIDTAGIREAKDEVEKIGIIKAKKIAKDADLVIAIFDSSTELNEEDKQILELIKDKKTIIVLNKIDKNKKITDKTQEIVKTNKRVLNISALNNIGIEDLYKTISEMFKLNEISAGNEAIVTNIRHKNLIEKALKQIKTSKENINKNMPIDIIAINMKESLERLGEITGRNVTDDIINKIFSKFCLGK